MMQHWTTAEAAHLNTFPGRTDLSKLERRTLDDLSRASQTVVMLADILRKEHDCGDALTPETCGTCAFLRKVVV